MGKQLLTYFAEADRRGGLPARMLLARLTRLSSSQSVSEPDTGALVDRFRQAMVEVAREYNRAEDGVSAPDPAHASVASNERARRHGQVMTDLVAQRSLFLSNKDKAFQLATEGAARALDVARASIWLCDDACTLIRCVDLFERGGAKHSAGTTLFEKDFQGYFAALRKERTIAAHDAHTDPRTACFSVPYLAPLGITSMLDVPIWANGRMAGVVCHEQVGPKRTWLGEEEDFAYMLGNMVALALEP